MDATLEFLRRLLHEGTRAREVCSAARWNRWGRRVASCSYPPGHEHDHRDVHTGATWP